MAITKDLVVKIVVDSAEFEQKMDALQAKVEKLTSWLLPEGVSLNNIQRLQKQNDDLRDSMRQLANRIYRLEHPLLSSVAETLKQLAESDLEVVEKVGTDIEVEKANAAAAQRAENERMKRIVFENRCQHTMSPYPCNCPTMHMHSNPKS